MIASNYWLEAPSSIVTLPAVRAMHKELPREGEADKLANAWKSYALENTWKYYNGASQFEKCLLALLDWRQEAPTQKQKTIDVAWGPGLKSLDAQQWAREQEKLADRRIEK